MERKTIFILIIFFFYSKITLACINEFKALLNGEIEYSESITFLPEPRFKLNDKTYLLKKLKESKKLYNQTMDFKDYSDFGVMLVYNGEYQKAKEIFLEIANELPGEYQVYSNLGTTYELLGQIDSALFWLKKSLEINPYSHNGSEWIHLKILEAKLRANGNENLLWTYNILSLDFGIERIPVLNNNIDLDTLRVHLYSQLSERMTFVKPKDPIIAQLLFDLGNINAITVDANSGLKVFELAKKYGYSSHVIDLRISYLENLQLKADFYNWVDNNMLLFIVILILSIIFLIKFVFTIAKFYRNKK